MGHVETKSLRLDSLDSERIRGDFPILRRRVRDHPLIYLDSAATTQKPEAVIDAVDRVYREEYANVHRGLHYLSQKTTEQYEAAREKVRAFINAAKTKEIIFVRGTTEAINLVAASFGRPSLRPGDEILISIMEHHSNIVPWQILCETTGARLRAVPISDRGELRMDSYEEMLGPRTRLVAIVHVSNALGTINPIKSIIDLAHERGIPVLVDGAQAVPHLRVDVRALDCDFYAFSGHKIYGPTGIGVLYGRQDLLEAMPPYQSGGEMIENVTLEKTTYNELPFRFEAGTPNIAGAIGLGAAIDYMEGIGLASIGAHEADLLQYATARLTEVHGLRIIGEASQKSSIISFVHESIHPHDIGSILDSEGIAIRTGHHCAQPVMDRFGVPATARISLGVYNTREDIDAAVSALGKAIELFA
ncbi:cysteine desulfurase [Candidatus Sumerlaeota bacterium]|nr:cysteine desulfurase [Candidatus Sumerlaeota bacterium]